MDIRCCPSYCPIVEQAKVILMAEAIAPVISTAGDYIFRIQPSATFYASKLLRFLRDRLDLKSISIIYCNNDFGVALRDTLRVEAKIGNFNYDRRNSPPRHPRLSHKFTKNKSSQASSFVYGRLPRATLDHTASQGARP